jgi:hypothetical protein
MDNDKQPGAAESPVECTYDSCNELFDTLKDMKRHKVNADWHYYCKKCDLDFNRDFDRFLHKISTPAKHITCPDCGRDERTWTGLRRHVEINHPHKQEIKCLACKKICPTAVSIIDHIQGGECKITNEEWQLERAQRTVAKEAFIQEYEQSIGARTVPLPPTSDLLSGEPSLITSDNAARDQKADNIESDTNEVASRLSSVAIQEPSDLLLPSSQGTQPISIAEVSRAHQARATSLVARTTPTFKLRDFWCPIREQYICPGKDCGQMFSNPTHFLNHLRGRHASSVSTCPKCLKRFNGPRPLIAHMESPSQKCDIRYSVNYNQVLREVSAGLLATGGHLPDGGVKYIMPQDEGWQPEDAPWDENQSPQVNLEKVNW